MLSRLSILLALAALLVLGWPAGLQAQGSVPPPGPVVLTGAQGKYTLGRHLQLLDDPTGKLTIDDVRSPEHSGKFVASTADTPVFPRSSAAHWARVTVRNASSDPNWILAFDPYTQDHVGYYLYDGAGRPIATTETGGALPFSTRNLPTPNYSFRAPIPPGQEATLYLRIAGEYPFRFPLSLQSLPAFVGGSDTVLLLSASMYGFLLLMAVYALVMAGLLRDRNYLLLALFIVATAVSMSLRDGRAAQFLWPGQPAAARIAVPIIIALNQICVLLFAMSFLETRVYAPRLHKMLLVVLAVLVSALLLLLPMGAGRVSFGTVLTILVGLATPVTLLLAVAGPLVWWRGNPSARYFTLALWIPLVFGIFDVISVLGVLPIPPAAALVPRVGNVLLVLLLALALADGVRALNLRAQQATAASQASEQLSRQYLDAMPLGVSVYNSQPSLIYTNRAAQAMLRRVMPGPAAALAEEPKNYPVYRTGTDELYPESALPLNQSLNGRSATADDLALDVDGRRVPLEVWSTPLRDAGGRLQGVMSVFADISEKKRVEAELRQYRDELERLVDERTRELSDANLALVAKQRVADSLREAATLLNAGQGLGHVLSRILELLGRVIAYDDAAIFLDDGSDIVMVGAAGRAQKDLGRRIAIGSNDARACVYREGRLLVLDQPEAELVSTTFAEQETVSNWVGLPLCVEDRTFGVLAIDSHKSWLHLANDLDLLQAFAGQAAAVAWIARSYDQAQATAALAERERLARDLHDAVTQTLFSASIIADLLPAQMAQDPAQATANLSKLGQLMRSGLAEMRTLLMELRPAALVSASLGQLVDNLVQAAKVRSRVQFLYSVHGRPALPLPGDVQIAIYRIVQELLNNVIKHSGATACRIELWYNPDNVEISIADNGRGFGPQAPSPDHMGLAIMRERARGIGAELTIDSQPEEGVYAKLCWPGGEGGEES